MARILIVDDEPQIRRALRRALEAEGMEVQAAEDGAQALDAAAAFPPDTVILDLAMPGVTGLEVIRDVRRWSQIPIIVLSVADDEATKLEALESGADDYVTKPFSIREVVARVRVQLRRMAGKASGEPVIASGDLRIDIARRRVSRGDEEIHLTPIEFSLLEYLVANADRVITHRAILTQVWGPAYTDAPHYVRIHVSHLRRKLEDDPDRPKLIRTEPGVGYRFEPGSD